MDTNLTNKLCNKIQYIGCDDATLDLFESQYPLPNGMCYNSYLLMGERVAVMDVWTNARRQSGYKRLSSPNARSIS